VQALQARQMIELVQNIKNKTMAHLYFCLIPSCVAVPSVYSVRVAVVAVTWMAGAGVTGLRFSESFRFYVHPEEPDSSVAERWMDWAGCEGLLF
jgi:hypothetical protein